MVAQPISDLTTNQYNAMLAGIVYGVIDQNDATEIEACIADGETEAKSAYAAFEDLWVHQWTTGLKEVASVVVALPALMKTCISIKSDVAELENWAGVFLAPADLEDVIKYNVKHSLIKLTRDLNQAKKEWAAEDYFAFGEELGDMLVIGTQAVPSAF